MARDNRRDAGQYYPGGAVITVRPIVGGGDMRHEDFTDVAKLPERYTDKMMHNKINEVIGLLKGPSAAIALLLGAAAFGAGVTVQTAPKDEVFNDEPIVTNVVFDATGLATTGELESVRVGVESNSVDIATLSDSIETNAADIAATARAATNYTDQAVLGLVPYRQDGKIGAIGFIVPWGPYGYIEFLGESIHFYHPGIHGGTDVDRTITIPVADGAFALTNDIPTSMAWGAITGKPTTISGYGITDALKSDFTSLTNNAAFTSAVAAVSPPTDLTHVEAEIETNRTAIATLSARAYIEVVSADEVYYVFMTNQE